MDVNTLLSSNKSDIAELLKRMGSFEARLESASPATSAIQTHVDLPGLAREFQEFKSAVGQILSKLAAQIELLSLGQDRHEMFLRRKVRLFHGVTENKDEKVNEVVGKILTDQIKLPDVTLGDIQSCHRLGASSKKPRPILVRFRDAELRRLAWESKTELRGTGIVVSEFLTKPRHEVFMAARKHFGVRNCWSADGRIVILLPTKSRKKIETAAELQALTVMFPSTEEPESKPAKPYPEAEASPAAPSAAVKPTRAPATKVPAAATAKRTARAK